MINDQDPKQALQQTTLMTTFSLKGNVCMHYVVYSDNTFGRGLNLDPSWESQKSSFLTQLDWSSPASRLDSFFMF